MEYVPQPESAPETSKLFSDTFNNLKSLPDQPDNGRLEVRSYANDPRLMHGQKIVAVTTPDGAYKVGITLQEPTEYVAAPEISVDIINITERGSHNMLNLTLQPESDPLGNTEITTQAFTPSTIIHSAADQEFLQRIGLQTAVEHDSTPDTSNSFNVAQYPAVPYELQAVGALPQTVGGQ